MRSFDDNVIIWYHQADLMIYSPKQELNQLEVQKRTN